MSDQIQCECGCGQMIAAKDNKGRPRRFVRGHAMLGKRHSDEWRARQSEGLQKAWQDPAKLQAVRNPSPELVERRAAKLRGRKHSPDVVAKISASLRGRKLSAEHYSKSSSGFLNGFPSLSPEAQKKCRESMRLARLGKPNYGRAKRGRPDHCHAKHWVIRDPNGVTFDVDNLTEWCRANEHRFLPDDRPMSKLPLWRRAFSGFQNQTRTDRKGQHHWRGWTLVSLVEREQLQAPDLLQRKEFDGQQKQT